MCQVPEGDTPLHISWTFHGNDVTTHTQKGMTTTKFGHRSSILLIDPVTDAGNVTCSVRNAAGSVNYSAELIVQSLFLKVDCFCKDSSAAHIYT